ncbi:MAG: DUF4838 domain-containing protein [Anaerohalosphaera sp.]|nr:DUF4838 domain-containing protein [Anaerohalosphaera sp.]
MRYAVTYYRLMLLCVLFSVFSYCDGAVISRDGQALAVIVVDGEASSPVMHSAAELCKYLDQVTGGKFDIVNTAPKEGTRILVGSAAAKVVYHDFSIEGLGADGVRILTKGDDLILAGGEPRGTLYAVYSFLEQLGCRWWSSKASTIPIKPTVEIGEIDITYEPVVEYRQAYWYDAFDGDWAVRNKCNGHASRVDESQGGKHKYEGFVHTFYSLIPPAKYFKEHPEWYSLINGKRKHEHTQLCLTNEEMRGELIKNLKKRLRANPDATIASVSQNDWRNNCQCEKCVTTDTQEGSPAGTLLRFVNAVAKEIEKDFPDVAISTLAYQYTRKPPKLVKPLDNVIVRLCSIECSFAKPLADECNKTFRDDIIGWSKVCQRLYIWDYTTNFRHYFRPHPNLEVLGPNVKFFVKYGVRGIFEQGAYTTNGAEMAELRAWVLAKLMWDPTLDGDELIDEFLEGYYGGAAEHVANYLDTIHESIAKTDEYLRCLPSYTSPPPKFLSYTVLREGLKHLAKAETAVKGDAELTNRVQMAQLPVMYCYMRQWKTFRRDAVARGDMWPMDDSVKSVQEKFMTIAKRNGVIRVNEWYDGFGLVEEAVKRAVK